MRRSLAGIALAAGLLIASVTPVLATKSPSGASLPACDYRDELTPYRSYDDWQKTLLDPIFMVPSSYVPPDLVSVGQAGINGTGQVRRLVIDDLRAMTAAAAKAGAPIAVQSAYRSYARQKTIFNDHVRKDGLQQARLSSARPGHSEHQLGTTLDFKSKGGTAPWNLADWAKTKAGAWMKNNAWKFGFVMSYPKARSPEKTCYKYESWHYRYFGRDVAAQIQNSGLSIREFLWQQGYGENRPAAGPSVPTGLTGVTQDNYAVALSWNPSTSSAPGPMLYRVFRDGSPIGSQQTELTLVDNPGREGTFTYQVRAIDSAGRRSALSPSIQVTTAAKASDPGVGAGPTVPAGLTATAHDNFVIRLAWQASTSNVSGPIRYRVFRNGEAIGTRQLELTFTDQRQRANTFRYQVRAIDAAGNRSPLSEPVVISSVRQAAR